MNQAKTEFHIVAEYYTGGELDFIEQVRWPAGTDPKDTPTCGYDNSKCPCRYLKGDIWRIYAINPHNKIYQNIYLTKRKIQFVLLLNFNITY